MAATEWFEEKGFTRARLHLGKDDFAEIVCPSLDALAPLAELQAAPVQGDLDPIYQLLVGLFTASLVRLELGDAIRDGVASGPTWDPKGPEEQRLAAVRAMPARVVHRIVEGIGRLAGREE